jgi:hypothetical protein
MPCDADLGAAALFIALEPPLLRHTRHVFDASAPLRAVFVDISATSPGRRGSSAHLLPVGTHLSSPHRRKALMNSENTVYAQP